MPSAGFWNYLPIEEERIPLPPMKPTYGRKDRYEGHRVLSWINIPELTVFLCVTYAILGFTRIGIILMDW